MKILFVKNIVQNIFQVIYYYNIRFLYRIKEVIKNIFINILDHEKFIETIQDRQRCEEEWDKPDGGRGFVIQSADTKSKET